MKKLLIITLLFTLCSCVHFSYKSKRSGIIVDNFEKDYNELPEWFNNDIENDDGFTNFGISFYSEKSYSDRILEAENNAKEKISTKIKNDLIDLTNQTFEANSEIQKQNFESPDILVEEIMNFIPINSFKRLGIYDDKKTGDLYVYGILYYLDINNNIDKIEKIVINKMKNYNFSQDSIDSYLTMIKKLFNVYEEEML